MTLKKLGRYDLIRVLGKGAMGLVYEGRDPNLDRRVAIKTIKVENLSEEAAAEYEVRFRTEARSAARLQHPNIVSVYDSDRDGDIAFLVMEFVQGDDLKHHLDMGDRHTLEQTLGIMADLLSALDYAHRQNIVHRDIKPANLLIEASGRVKLTDFGVARIQDSGDVTRTQGSMVGTLKYMSPEQVQGQRIDSRSDLFAAGVVLYQLLTGKRPFDGDSDFAIIQQIVAHTPAAPSTFNPKLPRAIDGVVARALAKSRDQRFATGQEFATALQAAAGQAYDPTAVAPASPFAAAANSTWTGTLRHGESLVDTQGGTATNGSSVTQELELVYWKDVKDSTDVEDLQGFLARFPAGIYTDLARRRLKKLGVAGADDAGLGSQSGIAGVDKTMLMPTDGSGGAGDPAPNRIDSAWDALGDTAAPAPASEAAPSVPAPGPATSPEPGEAPFAEEPAPASTPPASRRWAWLLAGVVALVGAGLLFQQMSAPEATGIQSAAPADPGAAIAVAPATAASTAAPTVVAQPEATAASAAPVVAATAMASAKHPSATVAVAKKATNDKEKDPSAKPAPAKVAGAVATPEPARVEHATQRLSPAPTSAAALATAANPRQACEGRKLFAYQSCMTEQCAKPAFASDPECVERRAMDQRRQEAGQSRR